MTEQRDRDMDPTGSETTEGEPASVGLAETGSLGAGGGTGSMAGQVESGWQGQTAGQDGGAMGQEGVAGGESWEGRARDIGTDAHTTGDAGFGSESADDGGHGSGEQTERS